MALEKVKELPSGVEGEYWKIIQATVDKTKMELTVKISLFKDHAASSAGKKPMGLIHSFSGIFSNEQLSGNLVELGYEMIKDQCAASAPGIASGKLMAYNDLKNSIND